MDNLISEKYLIFENEEFLERETDEQAFERIMGVPFDSNRYEIVHNDDAYDDGYDNPISTFNIIEKRLIKEVKIKPNEFFQGRQETDAQAFERVMGIPFDPDRYKIVKNDDAYDDGFDSPIATFDIVERIPVEKITVKPQEAYFEGENDEAAFQRVMGIPFDPNKFVVVKNNDAYDDGFDGPVSTFDIVEIRPITVKKGKLIEDTPDIQPVEKTKTNLTSSTPEQTNLDTPNPNLTSDTPEQTNLDTPNPNLTSSTPEQTNSEKKNSQELYNELDDFERAFVDDAKAESLEPNDQEFDQMANERSINKDRVLEYFKKAKEEKEQKHKKELWDNLNDFEKMFVDDAKAEGLAPGDSEFDQMLDERTGIDRDKVIGYFEGRIVKKEPKVEEPKVEEPKKEEEEEKKEETKVENEYSKLSSEEIKERIKEIEEKRKEIDSRIIKIDLNATWKGTPEAMLDYIKLTKELDKLKKALAEKELIDNAENENLDNKTDIKNEENKSNEEEKEVNKTTPKEKENPSVSKDGGTYASRLEAYAKEKEAKPSNIDQYDDELLKMKFEEKKLATNEKRKEELDRLKKKRTLWYRLRNLFNSKNEINKEDSNSKRLGFTDIFVITSVTAIIGVLLIFIIKLIK